MFYNNRSIRFVSVLKKSAILQLVNAPLLVLLIQHFNYALEILLLILNFFHFIKMAIHKGHPQKNRIFDPLPPNSRASFMNGPYGTQRKKIFWIFLTNTIKPLEINLFIYLHPSIFLMFLNFDWYDPLIDLSGNK